MDETECGGWLSEAVVVNQVDCQVVPEILFDVAECRSFYETMLKQSSQHSFFYLGLLLRNLSIKLIIHQVFDCFVTAKNQLYIAHFKIETALRSLEVLIKELFPILYKKPSPSSPYAGFRSDGF